MDILSRILGLIWPPGPNATPAEMQRWSIAMATFMALVIAYVLLHSAWALGYVTKVDPGIPGPATSADLQTIKQDFHTQLNTSVKTLDRRITKIGKTVDAINVRLLKSDIQEQLVSRCIARQKGNAGAFDSANNELNGINGSPGMLDQWYSLTGRVYDIPPCDELLILQH